jgi:hypothetical protein
VRHPQQNALATVIRSLAADKSPACLLDTQGVFLFVNDAWDRHAIANGGAPACLGASLIGTPWLRHIRGEEVRRRHAALFERAVRAHGPHPRPVIQVGESNTPTTAALVSTRLELVLQGAEPLAIRIVHTTIRERPIAEVYDLVQGSADTYRHPGGEIIQCSCCRRVRDPAEPERWDFVPALLAEPPTAGQTLCELCGQLHYIEIEPALGELTHPVIPHPAISGQAQDGCAAHAGHGDEDRPRTGCSLSGRAV